MLGEAALTEADSRRYFERYLKAIEAVGAAATPHLRGQRTAPGISIKLSALHPRFEFAQGARLARELAPRVIALAEAAHAAGIAITIDAEEAERLEPTLDIFETAWRALDGEGLGLAVQAYQKRAIAVIDWLAALAESGARCIPVRLVKGAYWDTEIKRAQERGLAGYPVFTRKAATDVSWLACARRLFERAGALYPQLATHNAHGIAAALELAGGTEFEFQRLHGMGEALYAGVLESAPGIACRVYAPVGSHEDLLPYLVRRLLENGANTSFLHHVLDEAVPVDTLTADPADRLAAAGAGPNPRIPLPVDLYPGRRNTPGINLDDPLETDALERKRARARETTPTAAPLVGGETIAGEPRAVTSPADPDRIAGYVVAADAGAVHRACDLAAAAHPAWAARPAADRANILERAADLMERERAALVALVVTEGGRCIVDADAELREAADYCRYYAQLARELLVRPRPLPGPTGEHNELQLHGRGVFACISPWNFPLAIYTGQIVAALVTGNTVIAKPASQTPLAGHAAVRLLHEAGVPPDALHFLPGPGGELAAHLLGDPRLSGVVFTGSTATARSIHRRLAARDGPLVPLIAETGGLNAMIVDSSALPEQAVQDAVRSAFNSAGQRCSALRLMFVQEEIAPRIFDLLAGAIAELAVGDPADLATDVGPVIGPGARDALVAHAGRMRHAGRPIAEARAPGGRGAFFAPRAYEIPDAGLLREEVFGPILHVVRYRASDLDRVIEAIDASGYGLTLGIHTRIEAFARNVQSRLRIGNTYVNRNQIGAVVGVQPFGGERLSGTGPKAGGPHYLLPFLTERTLTVNTAATGGNPELLSLGD